MTVSLSEKIKKNVSVVLYISVSVREKNKFRLTKFMNSNRKNRFTQYKSHRDQYFMAMKIRDVG